MELITITEPATIKTYFLKVRELQKSGKNFPVNLDDVYPLVYSQRGKAVSHLRDNFIENEDFIIAFPNGKAKRGGQNKQDYFLSVSAMEFFIAKKVKEVFEVYRQVFHKSVDEKENKTLSQIDVILQSALILKEQEERISNVEEKIKVIEAQNTIVPDYFAVAGYASLNGIAVSLPVAAALGKLATKECKEQNIMMGKVNHAHYGQVNTYPYDVLKNVFAEYFKN